MSDVTAELINDWLAKNDLDLPISQKTTPSSKSKKSEG